MEKAIYGQSYLLELKESLLNADALTNLIIAPETAGVWVKPGFQRLAMYAQDLLEKLGYMHYSLERLNDCSNQLLADTYGKFYFYTFVYLAKATHDTGALVLNEVLKLGIPIGGGLDLSKEKEFKRALEKVNPNAAIEIRRFDSTLQKVDKWRDATIHNTGIPVLRLPVSGGATDFRIPKEPLSLAQMMYKSTNLVKGTEIAREFCRDILWDTSRLVDKIFAIAVSEIVAKRYP
jgi:hypothetical protein